MPRSREELVEALRDEVRSDRRRGLAVEALLTEAADLLDSLEEREEWRVVANGSRKGVHVSRPMTKLLASAHADELRKAYAYDGKVRIQHHTTYETPWTDVEEGTDGC